MSKAKAEVESQEITATKKELANIKKGYQALGPALASYASTESQEAAKGEIVADALAAFAETQCSGLSQLLKTLSIAQRKVDNNLSVIAGITKEGIVGPIVETLEVDIKRVSDLKKKQCMARVKYDAAMNDLIVIQKRNDVNKIQRAQEMILQAKAVYDVASAEFAEASQILQEKVDSELSHQLKAYAKLQMDYFQKGAAIWQTVVRQMDKD